MWPTLAVKIIQVPHPASFKSTVCRTLRLGASPVQGSMWEGSILQLHSAKTIYVDSSSTAAGLAVTTLYTPLRSLTWTRPAEAVLRYTRSCSISSYLSLSRRADMKSSCSKKMKESALSTEVAKLCQI